MKKYCIARVLGNDLPPRHGPEQTFLNLKFILENESRFDDCKNIWVVNRIIDATAEKKIIDLLNLHKQEFVHLPFELDRYDLSWEFDKKLNYIIQLNTARNVAISAAQAEADWIISSDGTIFFDHEGWTNITAEIQSARSELFRIAVYRLIKDNSEALPFDIGKYKMEQEQMVACRRSHELIFDESLPYSREEKLVLLKKYASSPLVGYSIRLFDYTRFGFVVELRAGNRLKAMNLLVSKVDALFSGNKQ